MSSPRLNIFSGQDMPDLAELPLPHAVSLFPQTLAWKLLFIGIAFVLLLTGLFLYRRYQRRFWRRQALILAKSAQRHAQADEWFVLIRRVSLLHLSAQQMSVLSDQQLLAQLPGLSESVQHTLIASHYRRQGTLPQAVNTCLAMAFHQWLKGLPDV